MANKSAWGSRSKNEFEKKLVGIVKVVTGDTKAKFVLQEDGKTFGNGKDSLTVELSDLPDVPKLARNDKSGKEYRIRTNSEKDAIEAITPVRGHFTAKLVDIGPHPEKDADPVPQEKVFDEGGPKEERHLEFFAVYEITSGTFKGVQLPAYWMHYKFEEDPDNEGYTRFAGNFENRKATRLFQLRDWVQVHGLDREMLPWDDVTILPELLDRALENGREVEVNLSNGYILREGGVLPTDGYAEDAFGVGDVDEEFPPVEVPVAKKNGKNVPEPKAPPAKAKKIRKNEPVEELDDDL